MTGQAMDDYHPEQLEDRTLEILDTLFNVYGTPIDTNLIIDGIAVDKTIYIPNSNKKILDVYNRRRNRSVQFKYWQDTRKAIPTKDFFILKNHPHSFVRWYILSHIVEKVLVPSNMEFLLTHLTDVEDITLMNRDRSLYKTPLILDLIKTPKLTRKEKKIYRSKQDSVGKLILKLTPDTEQMTSYAILNLLTVDESNYETMRFYAKKDSNKYLVWKLQDYRNEQDHEFITAVINNMLLNEKVQPEHNFLVHNAVKYKSPKIPTEVYIGFHENAKKNNELESALRYYTTAYHQIVKSKDPQRVRILKELLNSKYSEEYPKESVAKEINNLILDEKGEDLKALKLQLIEDYGILKMMSLQDVIRAYPDKALPLVIEDLDLLERDQMKNKYLFTNMLRLVKENNIPTEKYILWALQSQDALLNDIAINKLGKTPPQSAKEPLFELLESPYVTHMDDRILARFKSYSLTETDKTRLRKWINEANLGGARSYLKKLVQELGVKF